VALITSIEVRIKTGDDPDAGNDDGSVYLGLCGREFHIDSAIDGDFEPNNDRRYLLGIAPNPLPTNWVMVSNSEENDPRNPQLNTSDLDRFPVYLRFEPRDGHWQLDRVQVKVNREAPSEVNYDRLVLEDSGSSQKRTLWLGHDTGKQVYLTRQ
jgi:hypothetical protein